jgi:hypothetical protein
LSYPTDRRLKRFSDGGILLLATPFGSSLLLIPLLQTLLAMPAISGGNSVACYNIEPQIITRSP